MLKGYRIEFLLRTWGQSKARELPTNTLTPLGAYLTLNIPNLRGPQDVAAQQLGLAPRFNIPTHLARTARQINALPPSRLTTLTLLYPGYVLHAAELAGPN